MPLNRNLTDDELSKLLRLGQESAFIEIYTRYWKKIYSAAKSRINDAYACEEIVQEIFCNLWRNREHFEIIKGFDNYFSVAVKNQVINFLIKKAKILRYEETAKKTHSEADYSTLQQISYSELQLHIQKALSVLPSRSAVIFNLKYVSGYSQKNIAQELSISEKTVEAHLARARKTIKESISILLFALLFFSVKN